MPHECNDCGQSFETLSRLRLHDCGDQQASVSPGPPTATSSDESTESAEPTYGYSREELEEKYPEFVGGLAELLADKNNSDPDIATVSQAIAEHDRLLTDTTTGEAPGGEELQTDLLFAYYEPLAERLDTLVDSQGWDVLLEFVDAYDTRGTDDLPEVTPVIANVVGRWIIRTRQTSGVEAIPAAALAYLGAIPGQKDTREIHRDLHYEEAYTYGWGIGHPEHSVADRLVELGSSEHKFVKITLNTAFYVDQHAAIEVLERLVTDETIDTTTDMLGRQVDLTEFYFKAVADLETEAMVGPHTPPYWEEGDELPRIIDVSDKVRQRIRELAVNAGVVADLPDDWSLQYFEDDLLTDVFEEMN